MRRLTIAILAVLWVSLPAVAGAKVNDGNTDVGGRIVDGSPEAVVVVSRSGTLGSWTGTPRGGPRWRCGYYAFDADPYDSDGGLAVVRYDDGPVDPEAGELYVLACHDPDGRLAYTILRRYDPADPLGPIAAVERALDEARRRLDLPAPVPGLNPPGEQLVGVATWLWVDGPWSAASATASVGTVAATVTAVPTGVRWDLGDGTTVTCDGPGTRWDPTRPPGEQASGCTHVYGRGSAPLPGGTYAVTATVTYAVTWSATTGAGGPLGTVERSATVPVAVREAQALIR